MAPLSDWESFYVIVGSSAAGLTGLQFVVIALIADRDRANTAREIDTFATPTIVHFGVVLLLSSILSAPWHTLTSPAVLLGACGLGGLIYSAVVIGRARRQTSYRMVLEDWMFFAALPVLAYLVLASAAVMLPSHPEKALFGVALTVMLVLFVGLHNAWDTVTFIAVSTKEGAGSSKKPPAKSP